MDSPLTGFMLVQVVVWGLCIGLAVPLMLRWVKPNCWYGFRTRKTLSNERVWYEANAYTGRLLLGLGIFEILAAISLYFVPGFCANPEAYMQLMTLLMVGGLGILLLLSFRYLSSL